MFNKLKSSLSNLFPTPIKNPNTTASTNIETESGIKLSTEDNQELLTK